MNLLLLSPSPPPYGGIARWTETVIKYCEKTDSIDLIHINTGNNTSDIVNRNFYQRYICNFFRIFTIISKIKSIIKKGHIDVAHITTSGDYSVIRDWIIAYYLYKKRIKYVYHLHFGTLKKLKESQSFRYRIIRSVVKKSMMTITMDLTTKDVLSEFNNICFIPNPIESVPYNLSENKIVLFLGYVVKTKGIEELLYAWKEIKNNYSDWILKIVGPYEEDYKSYLNRIVNDNSVVFVGEKSHDEAMIELSNASVLVLPSYTEGFPYSICEAMFSGKAIIASKVGAIPFMLSENSGLLCQRKNSNDLAIKLKQVLSDENLRIELGKNASSRAQELFEEKIVMKQYYNAWSNE